MSNEEAIANIIRLMTSFRLEIRALPDDLKCAKCKSVLKNAYQMPCDCRFCRTCLDDVISRGDQFCPGGSQECGATSLSTAVPDYRANKSILKLTAKCPRADCSRECPLADIEGHMRVCSSKHIDCPFRELGCAQGALSGEEISGHLLQESRSHDEMVAKIIRDMEMLILEMLMKDEQSKHVENEMKLIKIENESIKREKEVLCDRVRQLEQEIGERRQSDERDTAMVTAVTAAVTSNQDEMEPVRDDIGSISDQFDCITHQVESIQVVEGLVQFDDWLIDADLANIFWRGNAYAKTSGKFGAGEHSYLFELASFNPVCWVGFMVFLRIWAGPSDSVLQWPFRGTVTIIVADRDRREVCSRKTLECEIARPTDNRFDISNPFRFLHNELREAGVDLERGVLVSCRILPSAGR